MTHSTVRANEARCFVNLILLRVDGTIMHVKFYTLVVSLVVVMNAVYILVFCMKLSLVKCYNAD